MGLEFTVSSGLHNPLTASDAEDKTRTLSALASWTFRDYFGGQGDSVHP